MDIQSLISEANSIGISLFVEDGKLGYKTNEKLTDRSILKKISSRKSNIISYLEQHSATTNEIPVSLSQKRIWLAEQFQPEERLHNIPIQLRFSSHWDFKRLEQAIISLVAKHEILRTCYYEKNNEIFQDIKSNPSFHVEQYDYSTFDDGKLDKEINAFFNCRISLLEQLPI